MRLLILIPRQPRESGNWVSAERFARGLEQRGHQIRLAETDPDSPATFVPDLRAHPFDVALLLHAYRCGRPWLQAQPDGLPYALLLTGTDYFHDRLQPERADVIETMLHQAGAVLTHNSRMYSDLRHARPQLADRLHLLPVAASLGSRPFDLASRIQRRAGEILLLHPAGLRPVKRNLELLLLCDQLASAGKPFRLLFCGPELDTDYAVKFQAALAQRPWACWLGSVSQPAMASLMRQVDLILNHSTSEGLSNALVEAVTLGRPVLARDIPGNAQVVAHEVNGLLYSDDSGFLATATRLLDDPDLLRHLTRPPSPTGYNQEIEILEAILLSLAGH